MSSKHDDEQERERLASWEAARARQLEKLGVDIGEPMSRKAYEATLNGCAQCGDKAEFEYEDPTEEGLCRFCYEDFVACVYHNTDGDIETLIDHGQDVCEACRSCGGNSHAAPKRRAAELSVGKGRKL